MKKFCWVVIIVLQVVVLGFIMFLLKQDQEFSKELLATQNEQLFLAQRFAPDLAPQAQPFQYELQNDSLWLTGDTKTLVESHIADKTGEEFENDWAAIIAEPLNSNLVYFKTNIRGTVFQYHLSDKKFKKMPWFVPTFGPSLGEVSPNQFYQVDPCVENKEITCLIITNFLEGTQIQTPKLPLGFSYTKGLREIDGNPNVEGYWGNEENYTIKVFLQTPNLQIFDERYPVYKQTIWPNQI